MAQNRIFTFKGKVCLAPDLFAAAAAMRDYVGFDTFDLTDVLAELCAHHLPDPTPPAAPGGRVAELEAEVARLTALLMGGGVVSVSKGPMPKPEPVLSALAVEFGPYVRALNAAGLTDREIAKKINRDLGTERMHAMAVCAIKRELGLTPVKAA